MDQPYEHQGWNKSAVNHLFPKQVPPEQQLISAKGKHPKKWVKVISLSGSQNLEWIADIYRK